MTLFDTPDTPAAPSGPLVRVRMLVAYDGSGFHGFATQPGHRTVATDLHLPQGEDRLDERRDEEAHGELTRSVAQERLDDAW